MAAVQQRVLNWLYSVLTSEYQDVNRTYSDVAQALSHYSSLSPRTDVYTYEHGTSALLLQLSGTLPVTFRGATYRFPISVWIPHAYPREAPVMYITPTEGMIVRAGQHVDPQGKVYHPYLVGWAEFWDKSNILDFLAILRDVFAKEPPVVSRQPRAAPLPMQPASIPPPVPPLPPDIAIPPAAPVSSGSLSAGPPRPPPPPPKTYESTKPAQPSTSGTPRMTDSGPPLPPIPPGIGRPTVQSQISAQSYQKAYHPARQSSLRYGTAPPIPSQAIRGPTDTSMAPSIPSNRPQSHIQGPPWQHATSYRLDPNSQVAPFAPQTQVYQGQARQWQQYTEQRPPAQHIPKPPSPPDLIDEPLTFPSSEIHTTLPAPPIPPNPEKDLILSSLAKALHTQRQHSLTQIQSSLPGLRAQKTAMLTALSNMQAEVRALESLNGLLISNTNILHGALRDADAAIEGSQHRAPPVIDDILVAPTVVGNQLYELVSEERSLGDALFVLSRAVERGRVGAPVFAKTTRALAREWYLKKALARKIAKGMGLIDERTSHRR